MSVRKFKKYYSL